MLNPDDVRARKFTTVRGFKEGYNMGEVDLFLEQVAVTLSELTTQLTDARDAQPPATAARLLELAEQTAAGHIAEAEAAANARLSGLQHQVEALDARIAELQHIEREYRTRLKDFIASHLDEL